MSSLNNFCKKGSKSHEIVNNVVFRNTVEQKQNRRTVSGAQWLSRCLLNLRLTLHQVLQLEIVDDPVFTKHYLNSWKKILEKRVTDRDVRKSVRDPSKVCHAFLVTAKVKYRSGLSHLSMANP